MPKTVSPTRLTSAGFMRKNERKEKKELNYYLEMSLLEMKVYEQRTVDGSFAG